jgi:hypothetical protein
MRKKKTKRKQLETKLDKLWKSSGKEDAVCEICTTLPKSERVNYSQLHPHHIIGRKAKGTKWDVRNRLWVCPTHHTMGIPNNCVEFNLGGWFWGAEDDWLGNHRPEDKEYLTEKKSIPYTQWTIEELENLVKEFE